MSIGYQLREIALLALRDTRGELQRPSRFQFRLVKRHTILNRTIN
jgi:hypothetical protein